jgi:hypothetical protein
LSERDFDAGAKGLKCKLSDGRVVDWGMKKSQTGDEDVRQMLALPHVHTMAMMSRTEIQRILEYARGKAQHWPNNSRVRETLASWTVEVAKKAFESASDTTFDNETNQIYQVLCAVRDTGEGELLPPPAPDHIDETSFPALHAAGTLRGTAVKCGTLTTKHQQHNTAVPGAVCWKLVPLQLTVPRGAAPIHRRHTPVVMYQSVWTCSNNYEKNVTFARPWHPPTRRWNKRNRNTTKRSDR